MNDSSFPISKNTAMHSGPSLRRQIGLIFFTIILPGSVDGTTGILLPCFHAYYHLNLAIISQIFLFSTGGYLFASFSHGLIVDKIGQRTTFLLGAGAFLINVGLVTLRPPFLYVLMLQILQGYGAAILDISCNTFLAHLPQRITLLSYLHATHSIGAVLSPILAASLLAHGIEWNWLYVIWTLMALIVMIGLHIAFQAISVQHTGEVAGNTLLLSLQNRIILLSTLFFFLFVGVEFSLGNWSYSFLVEVSHGSPLLMGWIVGGYWCGELVGRLTLARLAQRLGEYTMTSICLAGGITGLLLMWQASHLALVAAGLFVTGVCFGPIAALCISYLSQRISTQLLPRAMGLLLCFGTTGNALFSWGAGTLAHNYGLQTLLPCEMLIAGVALCCWLCLHSRSGSSTGRVSPDTVDDSPPPDRR